ncbi:MAG TPA: HAMP domain-containing sensor histidine kinase [Acidimicrobiia bacterium]|nr:HAMP domain-containing sensor histidine kinase [Acidimicrobiia bacterium]
MIEPAHSLARFRLALLILSPVLLMALVSVAVSAILLGNLGPADGAAADAGLARIGDDLALVVVADGVAEIELARSAIADWGLLAPAIVLAVAAVGAWLIAGRVHRRIETARTQVRVANAERQSHLQEIAHELRTPLAVMGTNLELAGSGADPDRYIDAAQRAVLRMSRTVEDLAGHGQLAVEEAGEPVDLAVVAEAVAVEHVGPGSARGVFVRLSDAGPLIVDKVDAAAIRTVVGNFMTNAMRFAPKGSVVGLDWGKQGDWAWLSVTDQGPGLAPRDHARVFERGWQGPHDRDRREGSGLGMAIARQLAEAQAGQVTIDSEEGGGSTFALWIPLDDTADPETIIAADGIHPLSHPWAESLATV